MYKKILILIIIFMIFPYFVSSISTFVITETEKISLQTNATDPDSDNLLTIYAVPLNENGEWQTSYGDAGEYMTIITVSDGITNVSKEVLIIVNKKEESPKIDFFEPNQDTLNIKENDQIGFSVVASDLNGDKLNYEWLVDGKKLGDQNEFAYGTGYNDAGNHTIIARVSDGKHEVINEWKINVENVDVESLVDGIRDVTVNENDVARFEIPDLAKYGLTYSISEPIGSKNEWKTAYNDSGTYNVTLHVEGNGFSMEKILRAIVNDVDRPPIFEQLSNKFLGENEELRIVLNAYDPDGDEVNYSTNQLPEGAKLEGNVFTWTPTYETVKKEDFVGSVVDKFRVLSKTFYVQFIASSKDKKIVQNIVITVKDVNRPPFIEDMEPLTINEGDSLKIVPTAYDLDGDKITFSYSGFINADIYKSKFGDAGTYYVKVIASDGISETSKSVKIIINSINVAPLFEKINDINAMENDDIAILLNAHDPNGDSLNYSIDNPPQGSTLKGNVFFWTPGFDTLSKGEIKKFELVFSAADGKLQSSQIAKIEVADKNRAPRIVNATKGIVTRVNKPVLMFVKAVDDDGDDLSYTWDFGFFEKYKATATHQRIFSTPGTKVVKVHVGDGVDETVHIINVNVN